MVLGALAESGVVRKLFEARPQLVAIVSRLFNAASLDRVFGNRLQVTGRATREPIFSHSKRGNEPRRRPRYRQDRGCPGRW